MVALFDMGGWLAIANTLIYWFGIFLIIAGSAALCFFIVHYLSFDFKVNSGYELLFKQDGTPYLGKRRVNRFKWNKHKTAWRPLWPLFNKIEFPAFPLDCIQPGKMVDAARLIDGRWVPLFERTTPMMEDVKNDAGEVIGQRLTHVVNDYVPIPHQLKEAAILEIKRIEIETKNESDWEKNKPLLIMMATVLFCLILCGVTIYFTFQYANGFASELKGVGSTIGESIKDSLINLPGRTT